MLKAKSRAINASMVAFAQSYELDNCYRFLQSSAGKVVKRKINHGLDESHVHHVSLHLDTDVRRESQCGLFKSISDTNEKVSGRTKRELQEGERLMRVLSKQRDNAKEAAMRTKKDHQVPLT